MKKLNPLIVEYISKRAGINKKSVETDIYRLSKNYPASTKNAIAQIYAQKKGFSIFRKLDLEDRQSLPINERQEKLVIKSGRSRSKTSLSTILRYDTTDPFKLGHILELNKAYTFACYTSVFLLARKIIENLIIDILRKKYPEKSRTNKELYFNTSQGRFHDFSVILDNLCKRKGDFGTEFKAVEKLCNRCEPFRKDANDKAHSWYHLVEKKQEIDNLNVQEIINLILVLEKQTGLR